jgi:hypothetical protein
MAKRACLNPTGLLVGAGLLGLAACTEVGYSKPGVTDAEYAKDSQDCVEIARHQAFRDQTVFDTQWRSTTTFRHDRRNWNFQGFGPTLPDLEFRYRRLCMISRGYELVPLDAEDTGDAGDAEDTGDEPQ